MSYSEDVIIRTARLIRIATVSNLYRDEIITKEEAQEMLCGRLSPEDETSPFFDDSHLLCADIDDLAEAGLLLLYVNVVSRFISI